MTTLHTLNIHFWLKKSSVKKDGTSPIYARIWIDSLPADISTKESALEEHWCYNSNRVKPRIKNAKSVNEELDDINTKLKGAYKALKNEGRLITAQAVKLRFLGKDKAVLTCKDLIEFHKDNEFSKLVEGTTKNYASTEKYILRFLKYKFKSDDYPLAKLDYTFIVSFEEFLRKTTPLRKNKSLNNNGIMKHLERFQKLINLGIKHGWLKSNPFALYQLKFDDYDATFLEQEELETIINCCLSNNELIKLRNVFVFACYTGLSYIDVKNLKIGHICKGVDGELWIMGKRQKSKTAVKQPLLDEAKTILEEYADYPNEENDYSLLPVISSQKFNKNLKVLAKICHIDKNLTFHVARHTFATTITLLNDVPIETVSKVLGHKKLSTTQKYARVVEKKISNDFKQLKLKLRKEKEVVKEVKPKVYGHLQIV